jgi:hypothetical protein
MARIHGRGSKVYLGVGTAVPLSNAADWTLDLAFDSVDVSQLGDDWKQTLRGQGGWSGTINGPLETTTGTVWAATTSGVTCPLYIYPNWRVDGGATYYYGTAWFEASVKGGVTTAVTFTGKVVGLGPLTSYP